MLILCPAIYHRIFCSYKRYFLQKPYYGVLYLIFGLSIYNTSLAILFGDGFKSYITLLQPCKDTVHVWEMAWNLEEKMRLNVIDY